MYRVTELCQTNRIIGDSWVAGMGKMRVFRTESFCMA
jgi:hypothetical protein